MKKTACIIVLLISTFCQGARKPELRTGDIIFQVSRSPQSKAIQYATRSKYSHVGIIFIKNGKVYVCEAIQPVSLTPLQRFISRGEGKHYVVKRLRNAQGILSPLVLKKMYRVGRGFLGKNYDYYFEWSDRRIYCSELVWKMYKRAAGITLTELKTMADFDLSHPVVQQKMKERYGKHLPLKQQVVSPADIFNSALLYRVY